MKQESAVKKLNKLVLLRNKIAHQVSTDVAVNKQMVINHFEFIQRLAARSNRVVGSRLNLSLKKSNIWDFFLYRNFS